MFELSGFGKFLLFTAVTTGLLSALTKLKVKGSPDKVKALANAIFSSKEFKNTLSGKGSVDAAITAMNLKNMSAREFKNKFGVDWPF